MASIYKRPGSHFWWVKFRDPKSNKIVRESTGCRVGVGADTRRAEELEAQRTLAERQAPSGAPGKWDTWVTSFIDKEVSGRTAERYHTAWRMVRMFLDEHGIIAPSHLTYQNCSTYIKWRSEPDKRNGKYSAGKNTAILEFKLLRWLMREAVRQGWAVGNPAREVVLKRDPRKLFPDYTDDQLQKIYAAIQLEPEPERTCFLRAFAIALLHGVRLNETNVNPVADVKLDAEIPTIRFMQKGGRERIKPIHPQLAPLFKTLQEAKAATAYPLEKASERVRWGNRWTKFFLRHGFKDADPHACFHSLRVTVENVLREAGIEQRVRESYLTHEHGSADTNARYDRVKLREMLACHKPLQRDWLKL